MAYYIATLANRGVKTEVSILKEVIESNGETKNKNEISEVIDEKLGVEKVKTGDLGISDEIMNTIFEGMRSVTSDRGGTAYSTFSSFPIEVAGKTGTATASNGSPNAWFVGFAPYDNPEIAVVCVIEHGGHGSYTAPAVKEVMEEYFGYNNSNIDEDLTLKKINEIILE
jgi:penicillin-binding protein 2